MNTTRVGGVLATDVWDLSFAEWQTHRQMRQIADFLRRYVPGFARAYVAQSGVSIGVRETRRIVGDYQLTAEDVLSARKFPDAIARGSYPIDIHNPKGTGTVLQKLPPVRPTTSPCAACCPRGSTGSWSPGAASRARTRPTPPTESRPSPWPRDRRPGCAPHWV